MAVGRKGIHTRKAQLAFDAVSIEGGLLSPEWLSRIAQLAAGAQSEADYRIPKGLNLRDEIGRYWRIAQAYWQEFAAGVAGKGDAKKLAERLVTELLRESFGFGSLTDVDAVMLAGRAYPIGHAALHGRVPVVIAPAESGLDTPAIAFGDGGRRRSAFGLAQEYLNAHDGAGWGISSDGGTLRILRDNASLTRPAWIEADLRRIFSEERYADFAALWLVLHETRFGREGQPVTECALEAWRTAGREEGTRARQHLRRGVEDALIALGQGFLSHPANQDLRADLQSGALSTKNYFNQLLRLVYRLIFLLTVEERNLLHPQDAADEAKSLYARGYSVRRLSERSAKRGAHDRFSDLWESTKIVFRGVAMGEPRLGLPALAGLFAKAQCSALDTSQLENRSLLLAIFKLAWLREDHALTRVNWRDMGPEELGSVYEGLLELVPRIAKDGRDFAFATGDETKGNARKSSGSYYTPDSLVQVLLDSALEPVIADTIAAHPDNTVEALLDLSIVDPACGSGHFLLAAARRVASHVARLEAQGTPSAAEYRRAVRVVVGRCLYGVDLNPMAVEICKVSLWMEAVEPGLPLTFLNSHIQQGNALLGTTPELMAKGVPDGAWDPIEGDDKGIAGALRKRNNKAAEGQRSLDTLWSKQGNSDAEAVTRAVTELEAADDASRDALERKELQWDGILLSAAYRHQKFVADAWCSAFVWPKRTRALADAAPTNEVWRQLRDAQGQPLALTTETVVALADQYRFLHWHLQFPQVFAKGGFDVVVGNPPWERVNVKEKEWFAHRNPSIASASNAAARKRLIDALKVDNPQLHEEFLADLRRADGEISFLRNSGRYPLCGRGDINLYAVFAESMRALLKPSGRTGCVLPTGIATDDTTKLFFQDIVESKSLVSLFDFENRLRLFPGIDSRMKFCLFTAGRGTRATAETPEFVFFAHTVEDLRDPERRFNLSAEDIAMINPNTRTCPIFRSRRDAELTKAIHQRVPALVHSGATSTERWNIEIGRMFHTSDDSHLFTNSPQTPPASGFLPLYEAKCFWHFDHRFASFLSEDYKEVSGDQKSIATFVTRTRYVVRCKDIPSKYLPRMAKWHLAYRRITNATNERTLAVSIIPECGLLDSGNLIYCNDANDAAYLAASLNSFVADYVCRQSMGGTNLHRYILEQLPVIPRVQYSDICQWAAGQVTLGDWLRPRVLELTYTATDLKMFARDYTGEDGPPFRWNERRRFLLRCELDAAFFHLYGLASADVDHVMDTFPIVRKNDEKAHSEYRTKRVILEIYDAIATAVRTAEPYQTCLDPPPADSRIAHSDSRPHVSKRLP